MNKGMLVLGLLLLASFGSSAQDLNAFTIAQAGSVTFQYPCGTLSGITTDCEAHENATKTEVPPWIIAGGWRSYFLVDGKDSYVTSSPLDMINNTAIDLKDNGTIPATVTSHEGCGAGNTYPWRKDYYAVYSAQYVNHPTQGTVSLGFIHSEDHSIIGVNQPAVSCDGIDFPSYAGFVCGSWTPNVQSTNWGQQYFSNEMGPIVWPSTGYLLQSGQKSSLGVKHPSSIQADDGYLYVFYKDNVHYVVQPYSGYAGDTDFPYEDGRHNGMKVARAPISDALNPYAYTCFYEDANGEHWYPSLPAGFTKENATAFLRAQGPQCTNIMGIETEGHYDYNRFSVAKVNGTNYYLGVTSYQDYDDRWTNAQGQLMPKLKVSLRYSYDLKHWFGNRVIDASNDWTTSHFNYPIFLSTNGWSNTAIDANDFYIVGTSPSNLNNIVYRLHISIPPPPPPPPPPKDPPPVCYDSRGRQIRCPQSQTAAAMDATAAVLDDSEGGAPYVYPNPGHGAYHLTYTLKDHAVTQLNVLDLTGRRIQSGSAQLRSPGTVTESVDISSQAKGIYLLELMVNGGKRTFKMVYQ